jgi:predicted nucleic acid-binding protein
MKFWDSSAIIPLCVREKTSAAMRRIAKADEDIVVWWAARVECISAMARRLREGLLPADAERRAKNTLGELSNSWSEIQPTQAVRQRSERLLMIHPLRSADAFHLAAALLWAEDTPQGYEFVCLDQNLRDAARKEGFTVLP